MHLRVLFSTGNFLITTQKLTLNLLQFYCHQALFFNNKNLGTTATAATTLENLFQSIYAHISIDSAGASERCDRTAGTVIPKTRHRARVAGSMRCRGDS